MIGSSSLGWDERINGFCSELKWFAPVLRNVSARLCSVPPIARHVNAGAKKKSNLLMRQLLSVSGADDLKFHLRGSMRTLGSFLRTEPTAEWRDSPRGIETRRNCILPPLLSLPTICFMGSFRVEAKKDLECVKTPIASFFVTNDPMIVQRTMPKRDQGYFRNDRQPNCSGHRPSPGCLRRPLPLL